jgi:hypothetical protein
MQCILFSSVLINTSSSVFLPSSFFSYPKPNYVPTLEDEIEMQRSKLVDDLKKAGRTGTPITPETFAAWQERKRKARAEAARLKVEAEFKKKKGGKGLSVLSGRDLYEYKRDLFNKDDDDDNDNMTDGPTGTTSRQSSTISDTPVDQVAAKVQSNLFLQGDVDDLDDLDDD